MEWYRRPDGSTDDSLTDIGALALIGGYDSAAHVRACQRADGSFFRHPTTPDSTFSRDHLVSICFATIWTGDREPLKKFLRYSLKKGGKFGPGSIGQGMLNPVVLSAILSVLGHTRIAALLDVLNYPVLVLEALFIKLGYRSTLVSEIAVIKILTGHSPKLWRLLFSILTRRQPHNLWYRVLAGKATAKDAQDYRLSYDGPMTGRWHWNNATDDATGVDLAYLPHLARRLHEIYFGVYPCRNCSDFA